MKIKYYVLDAANQVVEVDTIEKWAPWFEHLSNRVVGYSEITSAKHFVSTVFIGLDHRFIGKGPPLLFETAVFKGPECDVLARYSSWDDAKIGHDAIVRRIRSERAAKQPS